MSLLFLDSTIDMPLKMVRLPVRCTVVKTSNGLVVISPIRFTTEQFKKIDELGEVKALIAPSLIHHLFMGAAMERFKSAKIWGPKGSREKCPHIRWDFLFGESEWPYSESLEAIPLEGAPSLNEVVFYDKKSQTLIVTDLLFNLQNPRGWAAPVILRLMGSYKKLSCSRLFYKKVIDKKSMNSSLKKVMAFPFDRIAVGHGDLVRSGGHALAEKSFREQGLLKI